MKRRYSGYSSPRRSDGIFLASRAARSLFASRRLRLARSRAPRGPGDESEETARDDGERRRNLVGTFPVGFREPEVHSVKREDADDDGHIRHGRDLAHFETHLKHGRHHETDRGRVETRERAAIQGLFPEGALQKGSTP